MAGALVDARTALAAYLVAWIAVTAIPLGALCWLQMTYLVHRAWTTDLHAILISATATLPLCGLLVIPILLGQQLLYPAANGADLPAFKAVYLAPWFFAARTIVYLLIWCVLAAWARAAWHNEAQMTRAASAGLIVYAITVSLAGIDWIQSLDPAFHSSIYGLLFVSFTLMAGLTFALGFGLSSRQRLASARGYGALLLGTILLWAYLHAMQYIVIWAGNIPDEVTWYLTRDTNGWQYVVAALALGQFVLPFLLLLSDHVRRDRRMLLILSLVTLVLRVVEALVLAIPAVHGLNVWLLPVLLIAALVLIASLWLSTFTTRFLRSPIVISARTAHAET